MGSLRKKLSGPLMWMAALFLTCGLAEATVIYTNTMTITAASPTQLGRLSRNGIPQDWSGGEAFPGVINPTTSYHYTTLDLDLAALQAAYNYGPYIQVNIDSTAATTFLAAYLDSYTSTNPGATWLGDAGASGNFPPPNPAFFQVVVGSPHHLILVLNETTTNGGLNLPAGILVEAFSDTEFTDLTPRTTVPEPATWLLLVCGMALLAARRWHGRRAMVARGNA